MEKVVIAEHEAAALLRYGRVYLPDGSFRYAIGPYPVAGTDMWVVAAHDSFSAPALVVFVVSVAALWAAAEGMSWMRSFF